MAVVLDASAVVALAIPERDHDSIVGRIFDSHVCYVTDAAVIDVYVAVFDMVGSDAAKHWLEFLITGKDIRIAEADHSAEFLESAGTAALVAARQVAVGTSAALARKMGVPLVTSVRDVQQLADAGFCKVVIF